MTLTLYNTLTRKKEPFRPIDPNNVRMYVCGPTVYDYAHIGNARPVIVFDVLFRLLRHIYGADHVTYARNITDVDDKINKRAADEGVSIRDLTERTARQFHDDIAALGVLLPTFEPRATEFIRRSDGKEDMVRLIETLVQRKHAYVAEEHVLFDVSSMPDYGRLSNRSLDEMEAGARVDVAPYKKGPMDFVLWKPSKPGEPSWPAPAGIETPGRPGWHIECSAMAGALLGDVFDIHGGGIDLVFPHHENEVAQSRCAHGTPVMANVWMHNGFLQVEGEKMSKSLGNFVTINELLKDWPGDVVRWAMIKTHYRKPVDWTQRALEEARTELTFVKGAVGEILARDIFRKRHPTNNNPIRAVLEDDLNTSRALGVLHQLSRSARKDEHKRAELLAGMEMLGFAPEITEANEKIRLISHNIEQSPAFQDALSGSIKHWNALANSAPVMRSLESFDVSNEMQTRFKLLTEVTQKFHAIANSSQFRNFVDEVGNFSKRVGELGGWDAVLDALKFCSPDQEFSLFVVEKAIANRINEKIEVRHSTRKAGDIKEADRIRDELSAMGIQLKDAKDPATGEIVTTWEVKR